MGLLTPIKYLYNTSIFVTVSPKELEPCPSKTNVMIWHWWALIALDVIIWHDIFSWKQVLNTYFLWFIKFKFLFDIYIFIFERLHKNLLSYKEMPNLCITFSSSDFPTIWPHQQIANLFSVSWDQRCKSIFIPFIIFSH